ncbi:hypothetical protein BT69DRAFT_803078 [Atractiella rhizophila]|nr:hypothetical protein BT69DRAFT_803078 [Atractiella rhizophila]
MTGATARITFEGTGITYLGSQHINHDNLSYSPGDAEPLQLSGNGQPAQFVAFRSLFGCEQDVTQPCSLPT